MWFCLWDSFFYIPKYCNFDKTNKVSLLIRCRCLLFLMSNSVVLNYFGHDKIVDGLQSVTGARIPNYFFVSEHLIASEKEVKCLMWNLCRYLRKPGLLPINFVLPYLFCKSFISWRERREYKRWTKQNIGKPLWR